ncbi:dual oxidase 2-like isoform X2 [Xenia sp. Carnegie-2017]|uniref:dual oxidase 2-like isoform X2 n=1 Tax=Xenia sp. Carnegie-2017 TaxID=2897299 RepID=UPI001F04CAA2|nr:dual oxidase 2-like isoform X2 [Xenia sp. Carnegie-2017]XP_046845730.1 dual oxidase 2-like isoform X2 [Xenia sp. Carnegie-2017]
MTPSLFRKVFAFSMVLLVYCGNGSTVSSQTVSSFRDSFPRISQRSHDKEEIEYEGYDGWYNNMAHPEWGAIDMPLTRRVPSHYKDGVYEPSGSERPNPLSLSQGLMNGSFGTPSSQRKSALLVFFGQQVVEEILDAQRPGCPPEYFNIEIPDDYTLYNNLGLTKKIIPFLRSRYHMTTGYSPNNPRQQLNEITPWLDGGLMYGVAKAWADALRSFQDGKLAHSKYGTQWPHENEIGLPMANPPPPANHKLKDAKRFFKLGNPRGNENPFLLTFGILWYRFHNIMAERIKNNTDITNDERLFNEARKWVIAVHQKIVFYDWLPRFLGQDPKQFREKDTYRYKPSVHPGVAHIFQSAAMRFGHTMVTPGVLRRLKDCTIPKTTSDSSDTGDTAFNKTGIRTCNSYWNPQVPIMEKNGDDYIDIEGFLRGMASQNAEREDNIITEDLRGFVFGGLDFSRRDLMAVNIQRGRDHGLPDYNTAREAYGLPKKNSFLEIKANNSHISDAVFDNLEKLTEGKMENIDVWVGGLLETTTEGPGELFSTIIEDQFRRIRDGDRFWFENEYNNLFTKEEIAQINNITLFDVILMSTSLTADEIQEDPFFTSESKCPAHTIGPDDVEDCTPPKTFDYFEDSEVSYLLTFVFIGLFVIGVAVVMFCLARSRQAMLAETRRLHRTKTQRSSKSADNEFIAAEWRRNLPERTVKVKLGPAKTIRVSSDRGQLLRTIDLKGMEWIIVFLQSDRERTLLSVRMDREYDMILKFDSEPQRKEFLETFETFLNKHDIKCNRNEMRTQMLISSAHTKEDRQKRLEKFFRVAFAHAFDIEYHDQGFDERMGEAKEVLSCELSRAEFAEALSLKANSLFVEQMFDLVDKDRNGYLSFREFLDVIVIFAKGTPDEKLRLFFDMYDVSGNQALGRDEFKGMIKSFMELVNADVESDQLDTLTDSMYAQAGFGDKEELTFDDFRAVMAEYKDSLEDARLDFTGTGVDVPAPGKEKKRENAPTRARKTVIKHLKGSEDRTPTRNPTRIKVTTKRTKESNHVLWTWIAKNVSNHMSAILIVVLYTLVLFAIFAERAYYYSVEREHGGLRRIAGYGVTVTRGAASAMMFTYSTLLVTMCRNLITFLRETFVGHYIPFDSNVLFHKYIALWALIFTVAHCVGHAINFYHVATQPPFDLTCLFRNYFRRTHELASFHYWCWETITGLTGVLLLLVVAVMYIFATQYSRRHVFNSFWLTHQLYVILYLLMVLHGSGNLVQRPFFHYFFLGPGILFALDKLVSMSRKKANIAVIKAELLPSDITHLEFKRPPNFEYIAGQWCRIACVSLGGGEYHPFTLTSAPHEDNLSLHIRAVGPWTINLRQTYDPVNLQSKPYPQLYLDGPFGEGHQDWYRYEVSVLVGGGIGVTPFASILKDIAHKGTVKSAFACKKVYFIWVTRTQKHFEWLTDIIREVEENDKNDLVSVHIFVTQFYHKFDLRTTMLYICERHFQKISGKSLFTGLRSITHFGRPDFPSFLESLSTIHSKASKIGVFSCGPPTMTRSVESACADLNKTEGAAFIHHFENF